MAHSHSSLAESSASILVRYLAAQGLVLDLGTAVRTLDAAGLASINDMKGRARSLKAALATVNVELKHTNALELVAKLEGYTSWMRAKAAATQHTDSVYFLQTAVDGVTQDHELLDSISDAISTMLRKGIDLVSTRTEPAFCDLRRNSQSIVLDVSQANASWFSLTIIPMNKWLAQKHGQATIASFDEGEQRQALVRLRDNIEQARPAALVLHGAISERFGPCHYAVWKLTNMKDSLQRIITDERELFLMLDSIDCTSVEWIHGAPRFVGTNDSFDAERIWVDSAGATSQTDFYTLTEAQQELRRFLRWRHALPSSVASVLQAIAQGSGDQDWVVKIDYEKLETHLRQREMSVAELAQALGVSYRDIFRLRDYEMADAELVLKMVSFFALTPADLLKESEGTLAFEVGNGNMLLSIAAGAHSYGSLVGESVLPPLASAARVQLQDCIDLLEIVSMQASIDGDIERRSEVEVVRLLDDSVNDLKKSGLLLSVGRDVRFVNSYGDGKGKQRFIPLNTLVLSVDHRDAATRTLWQPAVPDEKSSATSRP